MCSYTQQLVTDMWHMKEKLGMTFSVKINHLHAPSSTAACLPLQARAEARKYTASCHGCHPDTLIGFSRDSPVGE